MLLGGDLQIEDVKEVELETQYMDDTVVSACGMEPGRGVYSSRFGQRREWRGDDIHVKQFAGAFGAVSAAASVVQVRERLTCAEYTDREGRHALLGMVGLPAFAHTDERFAFCEVVDEVDYKCVAVVAREDIASRIEVKTTSRDRAEAVTKDLARRAAQQLANAW